jgi:phage shock protein C
MSKITIGDHTMKPDKPEYTNRKLCRSSSKAKISGICAGIAEHYGYEVWVVRIAAFCLFVAHAPLFILAYVVGTFILDKDNDQKNSANSHNSTYYRPQAGDVWRRGGEPKKVLKDLDDIYSNIESRLVNIERYVTSKKYHINQELRKM